VDPIPGLVPSLLNAIQAAEPSGSATAAPVAALLSLAGQELAMTLLAQAPGGAVSLGLPSGQVVTAQGRLPYPDGSQLLVQVQSAGPDNAVRLLIRQALPPAPPAILAPLYQGEAATLLAALGQPDPPPELAALGALFRLLGGGSQPAPDTGRIQAALDALPEASLAGLRALLQVPAGAAHDLASALEAWLAGAGEGEMEAPGPSGQNAANPAPGSAAQRPAVQAPAPDLVQRFQALVDRHPEVPQGASLVEWLRQLLAPGDARSPSGAEPAPAAQAGTADVSAQVLRALVGGGAGTAPGQAAPGTPETWEAWLGVAIRTLSDPAALPQAAPFHAAQAREGTAYYEIPLPWSPQSPLQMWVEADRDPRGRGQGREPTQRVLLGLTFTNLGETRLGITRTGPAMKVRVWTEHPERLEPSRTEMEGELRDLGGDLQILPLAPGPEGDIPSLRSLVGGGSLQALG
jgi:hypothetical protein